ncbi:MAG: chemotaxis protein CheW [Synergistaceae bacterium]|nr:chemotaxis protein CheW [Synergistota bacterium]NLM71471.1 chemotaxis protein CheW [Synergistaceae bacterium]
MEPKLNSDKVDRMDLILKQRAERLAKEPPKGWEERKDLVEVVEFRLGDERFVVASTSVGEVLRSEEPSVVPCTPPYVAGMVNLRGRIVTVIDLKRLFGLQGKGKSEERRVVVLRSGDLEVGLLVDSLEGMRNILFGDLRPPLPAMVGAYAAYVIGLEAEGAVVLDGERILRDDSLIVDDRV